MADEQEWAAFADQDHLKPTDTILARTSAGSGVEVSGTHIVSRNASGGMYHAEGPIATMPVGSVGTITGPITSAIPAGEIKCIVGAATGSIPGMTNGSLLFVPRQTSPTTINFYTYNRVLAVYIDTGGHFRPGVDNATNLGAPSTRWSTVYASTGTINTSDERDKTWRSGLSEDEYAAALEIIDELGFFQWNDSIAEKGPEDARYHFGVRAQQAFDILDEHLGVDAWRSYAFACHDSWDAELDENEVVIKEAGDRYGLREGQFTMFLLAAQARRQKELELRIEALEA